MLAKESTLPISSKISTSEMLTTLVVRENRSDNIVTTNQSISDSVGYRISIVEWRDDLYDMYIGLGWLSDFGKANN